MRLIFLLEEPSACLFLEEWMPRQFPNVDFLCIPHQGKTDLEKSLPKKLRSWHIAGDRFLVLRDKDSANCVEIKRKLVEICEEAGKPETVVRIACQELEAWYIGDLESVERAYAKDGIAEMKSRAKYRNPDTLANPSEEMHKLIPEFVKLDGARRLGRELTLDSSSSRSFRVFVEGVKRLVSRS